jgi:site-specific DNA recombinase
VSSSPCSGPASVATPIQRSTPTTFTRKTQLHRHRRCSRPPYGYLIVDAGPHPNSAKAADGKRLHKLEIDPEAVPVMVRIFSEFIAGHGFYAIAEG